MTGYCQAENVTSELVSVEEAGRRLDVSVSTIWRMLRRGSLPSVRKAGRRLVPARALTKARHVAAAESSAALFGKNHPIFRLIGAGRSGGRKPGARDKHAIIDA
jgi:excisionase family DNA binding protein